MKLTHMTATIEHADPEVVEKLAASLPAWLMDGMYEGSPRGTFKKIGPDD